MADLLRYKTVNATEGATSVSVGIKRNQILKICRNGEQKDEVNIISTPLSLMNGSQWVYLPGLLKRISFGTSYPFGQGEKIYIMYKVTI